MDFDEMMSRKQRATETVTIVIDHKWADQLATARTVLVPARARAAGAGLDVKADWDGVATVPAEIVAYQEAEADVAALVAQEPESVIRFVLRALSRSEFQRLLDAHQPTPKQRKDNPAIQWNPDTFGPALVAACSVEPRLSLEQTREMWDSANWSPGELGRLENTAFMLQGEVRKVEDA
jgi:hypothetical protein